METLSHKFLEALAVPGPSLRASAGECGFTGRGRGVVLRVVRQAFGLAVQDEYLDVAGAIEKQLPGAGQVDAGAGIAGGGEAGLAVAVLAAPVEAPTMPADVWGAFGGGGAVGAARSKNAGALSPDSQLLQPDPMPAPKKSKPRSNDGGWRLRRRGSCWSWWRRHCWWGLR